LKRYQFKLDQYQASRFFTAIRTKNDIIPLWMHAIKIATSYIEPEADQIAATMTLIVNKMSRLFITTNDKFFSINFPFFVQKIDTDFSVSTYNHSEINSIISSEIISLTQTNLILESESIDGFIESLLESNEDIENIWIILRDLMLCEDGYIRYDYDPIRANGKIHPLNHLDIFYSQSTTFKIGLNNRISLEHLEDILDIKTDCLFLH
jgi:hypothetical protein